MEQIPLKIKQLLEIIRRMLSQLLVQFLLPKPNATKIKTITITKPLVSNPIINSLSKNKIKTVRFNITINDVQTIIPSFESINDSNLDISTDKIWYKEEDYLSFK